MIALTSKSSSQVQFSGGSQGSGPLKKTLTVTIETGVAVFSLNGTHPNDWTRDTLAFPVGQTVAAADFVSGIASASPASFWTPMNNVPGGISNVNINGQIQAIPAFFPPPIGFAVDSATVSYSPATSLPELTMALAVFGNNASFLRVAYSVYIITSSGSIVSIPGGTAAG